MATVQRHDEIATPAPSRMTEGEFVAWLDGIEKPRVEWVDGDVIVMSPVNRDHMRVTEFLFRVLSTFVEDRNLGEVHVCDLANRFRVGDRLVRRLPDLWFVSGDRVDLILPTYLDGPPDLAVEIVSPDSQERDWGEKFRDYESAGVREYWIIDPPTERVEVWSLANRTFRRVGEVEGRLPSEVLPGFFLRPAWLWQEPLPRVREVLRELGV